MLHSDHHLLEQEATQILALDQSPFSVNLFPQHEVAFSTHHQLLVKLLEFCQKLCAHVGSVGFVYLRHLSCVPSCRGFSYTVSFCQVFMCTRVCLPQGPLELMSAQFPLM